MSDNDQLIFVTRIDSAIFRIRTPEFPAEFLQNPKLPPEIPDFLKIPPEIPDFKDSTKIHKDIRCVGI